ncbi:MAG: serine kinase, partial [Phototrophicales bacterium]
LKQCTDLETSVAMQRLRRRWGLDAIDEAVALVEDTIAKLR